MIHKYDMLPHFHLLTGLILCEAIEPRGDLLAWACLSLAPDTPYWLNLCANAVRKKMRGLTKDDLATWRWTNPLARALHGVPAYLALGTAIQLLAPAWSPAWWLGYGSHLSLDYLTHSRAEYPPLFPLNRSWSIRGWAYWGRGPQPMRVNLIGHLLLALAAMWTWV